METYNRDTLYSLLKNFNKLAEIKVSIYDAEENEVAFYPKKYTPFCELLRSDKKMDERCLSCDKRAIEHCKETKRRYLYICHAGLTECFSPVLYNEEIIGYIALGQIKIKDNKLLIDNSNNDYQELLKRFENLPSINEERVDSAINVLEACIRYEYLKTVISQINQKIDLEIEEFVSNRLAENLSVDLLCDHFHLSRNEIYSIFDKYFKMTPAKYIKEKRIKKACELLETTNLKVFEIGESVGLYDYNYFSKIFKNEIGCSPRNYRKNHLQNF